MARITTTVLAATTLALFALACGDDEDSSADPTEDFVAAANTICVDVSTQAAAAALEVGVPSSDERTAQLLEAQVPIREQGVEELAELDPPAEQQEDFDRFVDARGAHASAQGEFVEAYANGDRQTARQAYSEASAASDGAAEIAAELGLDDCALELSAEEEEAVRATLEEFETTDDLQRVCDELVTEQYLEVAHSGGGYEGCAQYRETHPDVFPDAIEFTSVQGVDGVVAIVRYENVGGRYDGSAADATLYYVDGGWKVFELSGLG